MNNNFVFMIPADFKVESVEKFATLNSNYKIPVAEFYGSLKTSKYGSGRKFFELPETTMNDFKNYVKAINAHGMSFNYVLNLSCNSNHEFTNNGKMDFVVEVQKLVDAGVDHFTIALPSLIDIFDTYFPDVKITLSIICGVDSLSKMKCYCNFKNIDNIYIHEGVYRQPKLMQNLVDIAHKHNKKVGIIVNSFCLSECPFRSYHYNFGAHATFGESYIIPEYYGSMCALMKIHDKRNVLNAPWVRPEDMMFYMKMGIDRYKISGREMFSNNANMFKVVDIYNSFEFKGNLAELFMCFTKCAYSEIFNISNDERLDKYLRDIQLGNIECNVNGCNDCMKCSNALQSITINEKSKIKWEKIFKDRINKYKEKTNE